MKKYFYGQELSSEEIERNRISYRTLAKCFDAVLCNNICEVDEYLFDNVVSGSLSTYYDENGNELTYEEYQEKLDNDENVDEVFDDIFQWYIVSDNARYLLEEANELVLYSEKLDCYIWCIKHYGTSWKYVFTDIKIDNEGK